MGHLSNAVDILIGILVLHGVWLFVLNGEIKRIEKALANSENAGEIEPGKSAKLVREKADAESGIDRPDGRY